MYIFYHSADHDGHCSGHLCYRYGDRDNYPVTLYPINYGDDFPLSSISPDEIVYIVDFSIPPETMIDLLSITPNVIWIDHHISAINNYSSFYKNHTSHRDLLHEVEGIRLDGVAASVLTYFWFHAKKEELNRSTITIDTISPYEKVAPEIIRYIADYDVWAFKYPSTRIIHHGLTIEDTSPSNIAFWNNVLRDNIDDFIRIYHHGEAILTSTEEKNKYLCEHHGYSRNIILPKSAIDPIPVPGMMNISAYIVNAPSISSDTFKSVPDHDLYVGYSYNGKTWTYQLRSTKIDCSVLAQYFNEKGGGHKGAAGFATDIPVQLFM